MFCMLELEKGKLKSVKTLSPSAIAFLLDAQKKSGEVLKTYKAISHMKDALDELDFWCKNTAQDAEHLMRNLHRAERLCRGFLYEFRTYQDHLKRDYVHRFGENSEIYQNYKNATHQAYDSFPEYAFTDQLRNYEQHCEMVVHTFEADKPAKHIQPCATVEKLLNNYKKWKPAEKAFIEAHVKSVDLLETFKTAYIAMDTIVHRSVVQYLLDHDGVASCLTGMRMFADKEFSRESIVYHHFAEVFHKDGTPVAEEEWSPELDVEFKVHTIDWQALYDLTDRMDPESYKVRFSKEE